MPEASYLLTDLPNQETVAILLPRGINIISSEPWGGALRVFIVGKDVVPGKGYQLVSTDGPLMRCIELVENPVDEDLLLSGEEKQPLKSRLGTIGQTVPTDG